MYTLPITVGNKMNFMKQLRYPRNVKSCLYIGMFTLLSTPVSVCVCAQY